MSLLETMYGVYRSAYSGKMDANEWRASRYGALDVFKKQTNSGAGILSGEDTDNLKKSFGLSSKIPVLDMQDVTIGSQRTCVIPPDQNNSKWIVVTFVTYAFGFTMIPSMYRLNDVKYELDFNKKMRKYILALLTKMDKACLAKLELERNKVFTGLTVEYPVLGNAFQIPYAEREDMYNQLSGIMATANFPSSRYDVITDSMHRPIFDKLRANGSQNADNTAFQLGPYDLHFSANMVQNPGVRNTLYVIPEDTLAIVNRNSPDCERGETASGGGEIWGTQLIDEVGLDFGTYYMDKCTDATAISPTAETTGLTQTKMQGFQFHTDVTYITTYNSNPMAKVGPIMKAELAVKAAA